MDKKKFDSKMLELAADGYCKSPRFEVLKIHEEYDINPDNTYPQFLYIPDESKVEHSHIPITKEKAKELYKWLKNYLEIVE